MKKGKNLNAGFAMSMFLLAMVSTATGQTMTVDDDGANNGSSQANHYDSLQDVPAASGLIVQWQKTLGGSSSDTGRSVQQTSDGGYIITGITYSYGAGDGDMYLIKTNPAGNMQWQKTFGGDNWDWGWTVRQTSDAGYIIAGTTTSFGLSKIYVIKTDSTGNVEWEKTLRGRGYSVQQTSDGGYIIAGETRPVGPGDCYLIKTDSTGNIQWQKTFGGSSSDWAQSVQQTTDGGYILAGYTQSYGAGRSDVYVVKTDSAGNMQWQKAFGGSDYDHGYSAQQTTDGGYIIIGYTDSYGAAYRAVYLIKTDSAGNMQWQKAFGGSNDDYGFSVQQTTDDGYIIAGETESFGAGREDVYLIKTDSAGNMIWQKTFGGSEFDCGWSVQQTNDGGYIVAGETSSYGEGSDDVYLIKLGPPNTSPVACIVGGDRMVECEGCCGARITLDGSCSSDSDSTPGTNDDIIYYDWYKVDPCDPNFEDSLGIGETIDCNLGLGEHIIVLEVFDKAGTFDTNEVTIIVQDTTPPEFALSVNPTTLWPPNKKMVKIMPTWTVSDKCDAIPWVSLVSISINESGTKGNGLPDDDVIIGDDGSIYLRAERNRAGQDRIYTITYRAVDDCENATVRSATVTVPHNRR